MPFERKLFLYIAASLDGYIAKPDDDLSFLSLVQKPGEDYGYGEFYQNVDTVIIGRKTYDWVRNHVSDLPYSGKETYVITRTPGPPRDRLNFYSGNLKELVLKLKREPGKNIFCDGGAEIVNELLKEKLIDELILSVIPILLGDGKRLFKDGRPEQKAELLKTRTYDTGLVQLHYVFPK